MTSLSVAVEGGLPAILITRGAVGCVNRDTPQTHGSAPSAPRAARVLLQQLPRRSGGPPGRRQPPRSATPPGGGGAASELGCSPSPLSCRRAVRGWRRYCHHLSLVNRRRGTGRPSPPRRRASTYPPSLRQRFGERPPAESPRACEPSWPAPRRGAAGAWKAAAEPGPPPSWADGE